MRGTLPELRSPVSMFEALPTIFHDGDFARRFVSAFDTLIAPVFATLDNFSAYLDPRTTPEDFLGWLAGWFDLELDADWSVNRRRAAVCQAIEVFQSRGTRRGVEAQLAVQLDADVEIDDGGGTKWSLVPGSALPGTGSHEVAVRVRAADITRLDRRRVEGLVRAVVPAHLVISVELTTEPVASTSGEPRSQEHSDRRADDEAGDFPPANDVLRADPDGSGAGTT